ncbi:MAG: hypothetical protein ACOYJX_05730 [Acutalibacteraceae bacterium]|jgi:hypothetical protein
MITVILIVIFLFVSWIAFIPPLDEYHLIQSTYPVIIGLVAVVITSATIIIRKLDRIYNEIKNIKDNERDKPKDDNSQLQ